MFDGSLFASGNAVVILFSRQIHSYIRVHDSLAQLTVRKRDIYNFGYIYIYAYMGFYQLFLAHTRTQ